jgi:DNA polymerase-3 subunit delta'
MEPDGRGPSARHEARVEVAGLLTSVRAQQPAVETLRRSVAAGRVHHAYLFDGPEGVGKELAAWGLAQVLVCERRAPGESEACGTCSSCQRAVPRAQEPTPRHPDVVVLERGLYEPATIGRRTPEIQDISIDQVRTLVLAHAAFPPREGRAKVFIVRRAEELGVPAANALLKTLEEPGAHTHFMLLTSAPDALLPTIRSRTQRVRFGSLPDDILASLLTAQGIDAAKAAEVAPFAAGSMTQALLLSDPEVNEQRRSFVSSALAALSARDLGPALDFAEAAKKLAKPALVAQLDALAAAIVAEGRVRARAADDRADSACARYTLARIAIRDIEGNASPQLAIEAMLIRMRGV